MDELVVGFGCSGATDAKCYCPSEEIIQDVFVCVGSNGDDNETVAQAIVYIQGVCAASVRGNPGIVTCAASITSTLGASATSVPSAVYTTVSATYTTQVACTDKNGNAIPGSTITTVSTDVATVPQCSFATGDAGSGSVVVAVSVTAAIPSSTADAKGIAGSLVTAAGPLYSSTLVPDATSTSAQLTSTFVTVNAGDRIQFYGLAGAAVLALAVLL